MKYSRFNKILDFNGKYYLYNSISNSISEINKKMYELFDNINNVTSSFEEILPNDIYQELIFNKNLVESDEYELLQIRNQINMYRNTGQTVFLTIAPTMDCNFDCYYCFEKKNMKS